MTKKIRDWMLIAFFVLFVLLTILISLYASGYKFNLTWPLRFNRLLVKTGMLNIATVPEKATVFINGDEQMSYSLLPWERQTLTTPVKIKNLIPGEYTLRLEREGYWPLEQRIWINSGQTTFAEDINLFKNNLPMLVLSGEDRYISISPDRRYVYLPTSGRLLNLKSEAAEKIALVAGGEEPVWLKNGSRFFIAGYSFYSDSAGLEKDYKKIYGDGVSLWRYEEKTGRLYYLRDGLIGRLESDGKTNATVAQGNKYLDFETKNGLLNTIEEDGKKIFLKSYSLNNPAITNREELPANGRYRFVASENRRGQIYDDQNKILYLVEYGEEKIIYSAVKGAKSWQWLDDNQIFYNNELEIYLYDIKNGNNWLLTRYGEKINKIIWQVDKNYLVFSTDNSINTFDLKSRVIVTLFKAEAIGDIALDDISDFLYFSASVGKQAGIYKLILQ